MNGLSISTAWRKHTDTICHICRFCIFDDIVSCQPKASFEWFSSYKINIKHCQKLSTLGPLCLWQCFIGGPFGGPFEAKLIPNFSLSTKFFFEHPNFSLNTKFFFEHQTLKIIIGQSVFVYLTLSLSLYLCICLFVFVFSSPSSLRHWAATFNNFDYV